MSIALGIFLVLSLILNGLLLYYSYKAARKLMDLSEELSIFWASIIEYKDYLDSINEMYLYENSGKIRGFIEATNSMIKEISNFRDFCELAEILSEEEMDLLQDMEEDYKEQKEKIKKEEMPEDEYIKSWDEDRKRKIEGQGRPKVPPRTKGVQQR